MSYEKLILFLVGMFVVFYGLHWLAGRWLRKRKLAEEPWESNLELWDKLDRLVSEAEAEGCRLWAEDGKIRFGGDVLTMRASAILTVLEKHHDDTLVVLANRKHG